MKPESNSLSDFTVILPEAAKMSEQFWNKNPYIHTFSMIILLFHPYRGSSVSCTVTCLSGICEEISGW